MSTTPEHAHTMTLIHGARKLDADDQVDDFWVLLDGGTISRTGTGTPPDVDGTVERVDAAGAWLTPGFIDLHCHGGGGRAFDDDTASIREALTIHRAHGTTRSVLSLVTNPLEHLHESLGSIAALAASDETVLGAHLEGPFLSAARKGAHNENHLTHPTASSVNDLIAASQGALRYVTIAPELPGALDAIESFAASGAVVGVGHTEADYDLTTEAFARGATVLTHAFNAMPGIHHRNPGPVVAALTDERVTLELVLDGVHVHPRVADTIFRAAPKRIALVTDAMPAAGAAAGHYQLGSLDVTVEGGRAVIAGTDTIAGSTLTADAALRFAITEVGVNPVDAVAALTSTPAAVLGLSERFGALAPGFAADAVLFGADWSVRAVWAAGTRVR